MGETENCNTLRFFYTCRCKIYTSIPDVCTLRKIDDCCTEPVCPGYRISAVDQNGRMFKLVKESSGKQMKGQGSRTQVLTATTSTIQTAEAVQGASYSAKIISKDSTQLGVTSKHVHSCCFCLLFNYLFLFFIFLLSYLFYLFTLLFSWFTYLL